MSGSITYDDLRRFVSPNGGGTLNCEERTTGAAPYAPLQGQTVDAGKNVFGHARVDGITHPTISLDSSASQKNRAEEQLLLIRNDPTRVGHETLAKMNGIDVTYRVKKHLVGGMADETILISDLELPNKNADAHVRFGDLDGIPFTQNPEYQRAMNARSDNLTPLLHMSPITLEAGTWNSLQGTSGIKLRAISRGETFGILASDTVSGAKNDAVGYRHDPLSAGYTNLTGPEKKRVFAEATKDRDVVSKLTADKVGKFASRLVVGNLPYSGTRGYACSAVIRYNVISLSALRALRFGGEIDDIGARAAILALSLFMDATVAENVRRLRTGCDLAIGDRRIIADHEDLPALSEAEAAELLAEAVAESPTGWTSHRWQLTGNKLLEKGFETKEVDE